MTTRRIIRADGTREELPGPVTIQDIERLIGAEDGVSTVALRHMGHPLHVLVVDDQGIFKGLPINHEATILYRANCKPGTTHVIRGDAVVVPDSDYET